MVVQNLKNKHTRWLLIVRLVQVKFLKPVTAIPEKRSRYPTLKVAFLMVLGNGKTSTYNQNDTWKV